MKRLFGRLLCLFGRHDRSARRVKPQGAYNVTVCRHCGVPMRQGGDRIWRIDPEAGA